MMLAYTHENSILVENAKNLLAHNGIPSELRNEYAAGALGELSAFDSWPEVWVSEEHYAKAKKILAKLSGPIEGKPWTCLNCAEINEPTFQHCWNCQKEVTDHA